MTLRLNMKLLVHCKYAKYYVPQLMVNFKCYLNCKVSLLDLVGEIHVGCSSFIRTINWSHRPIHDARSEFLNFLRRKHPQRGGRHALNFIKLRVLKETKMVIFSVTIEPWEGAFSVPPLLPPLSACTVYHEVVLIQCGCCCAECSKGYHCS